MCACFCEWAQLSWRMSSQFHESELDRLWTASSYRSHHYQWCNSHISTKYTLCALKKGDDENGKEQHGSLLLCIYTVYFATRNEAHNAMFKISSLIVCIALTLHWQTFAVWKLNFVGLMIIFLFFSCICKDNIYQHCCGKCHKLIYDITCCKHIEPVLGLKC